MFAFASSVAVAGVAVALGVAVSRACLAGFFEVCNWLLEKEHANRAGFNPVARH